MTATMDELLLLRDLVELEADNVQNNLAIAQQVEDARRRREARARRLWSRAWLIRRPLLGQYEQLMVEMSQEDVPGYKNFMRLEPMMFEELLNRVSGRIEKKDTWYRKAIPPGLMLAITLRHLATGDSYHSLMYGFRVAHNTISSIVRDVCEAIIAEYAEEVIACPTTHEEWQVIADKFGSRWQFHHALGALDGKHISIRCPKNSGSLYFNYKGYYSVVLMGLVDADYKFLWVDVGANGSASDAQIWNQCEMKEVIEDGSIGFPEATPLPADDRPMPYFIIGDDAFALRTWLMKPFSRRNMTDEERIFNYRLSRARRIVENAFGILSNRFGALLTTLRQQPETVKSIVMACICLHNLMRMRYPAAQNALVDQEDDNHNIIPGAWRDGANLDDMCDIVHGNLTTRVAKQQRLYLKHYLNSPRGAVPWQNNMI